MSDIEHPDFEDLRPGDCVKVPVGGERLWFQVVENTTAPFTVICKLDTTPLGQIVFDGRVTIQREWVVETARLAKSAIN